MELTMYDKLLQLPLFQGMSKFDFTDILEKVKIHFNKYEPGSCLVRQDTPCNQLIFVLDGEVQIESNDKTHKYTLWENFKSPNVIEPYSMFGMRPYFTASYTAVTEVNTLNIDKSYILNELCRYEVFNLNYMNMLSNRSQVIYNKLWNAHIGKTRDKIINFLLLRCMTPYGAKKLSEGSGAAVRQERLSVITTFIYLKQYEQSIFTTLSYTPRYYSFPADTD